MSKWVSGLSSHSFTYPLTHPSNLFCPNFSSLKRNLLDHGGTEIHLPTYSLTFPYALDSRLYVSILCSSVVLFLADSFLIHPRSGEGIMDGDFLFLLSEVER
jgi:hypothetical protein